MTAPRFRFSFAPLVLFFMPALLGANCAPKRCTDDSYCRRECDCEDVSIGAQVTCPVTFQCDTQQEVCESAWNEMSCDEICQTYAASGNCGTKRCTDERDCTRSVVCNSFDPQTGQLLDTFGCDFPIACDSTFNGCASDWTMTDDEICQRVATEGCPTS